MPMITLEQVSKSYELPHGTVVALHPTDLTLDEGSFTAFVGPSGSGKSTLLALAAGLERPTAGRVIVDSVRLAEQDEAALAHFRGERVGFIFQSFHLLRSLTALENVLVPAELLRRENAEVEAKALMERVGLTSRMNHYPHQLSGGEQQRVAIARAYINRPKILFGDEPTGNLDEESATAVESLLDELRRAHGTTVVLATHNLELASRADRVVRLRSGRIAEAQAAA